MRRVLTTLLAVLAALVVGISGPAWVLVAPPAKAAFPGQNGRIVFWREDSGGFAQTWVANRDLSNQHKLTRGPSNSGWAVWKPGGAKLAFDSDRADPDTSGGPTDISGINDIFKMNPDGTGVVKLTDSKSFNGSPGWSPDGKKIAFESDRRNHQGRMEIHVMDSDGTDVRRLTTLPSDARYDSAPRFSPDGGRIVFTRYITDPGRSALFTVRVVDGSGLKQLTPWGNGAGDADYSPDGKKLVFEAYPNNPCFGEIYTVDADGRHLTNIADNRCHAGSADPVWSPDGKEILFKSAHVEGGEFGIGLATMNPDGSARHHITPNTGVDEAHHPDWESVR